ncbi:MAG: NUDIX hydrolase [Flavobacteriaceae bacterium]|nr:NUDIX hydrolase [Flavobacteriaceae bacterium]|tara:strand:- start:13350 stop:13982 length:633 start_codon:yes stop_codon:yes gene_type:complete
MYKVFFNQKPLILTTSIVKNSDISPVIHSKFSSQSIIIKALKSNKTNKVYYYHSDFEKLSKHLEKKFKIVEAAGGMVKNSDGKYLMIYRKNKWDLPKGHLRRKELIMDAAIREVIEETNVKGLIIKRKLPTTYHIFRKDKFYFIKKTYWFFMYSNYKGSLTPQKKEKIEKAVWVDELEISKCMKNMYANIKTLYEFYFDEKLTDEGIKDL